MIRVSRAVNPQKRRKNLSAKQIRFFGTKRQRAALKAKRRPTSSHKHRSSASASNPRRKTSAKKRASAKRRNPVTKVVYRTKYKTRTRKVYVEKPRRKVKAKANRKRRSKKNPYLMTLSPVVGNPHKKRKRNKTMAKPKRRVSAKRSAKRKNPTRRRSVKGTSHRPRGSRNPFGHSTGDIAKTGFGVIIGVSGTKLIPRNFPASMTGSPTMSIVSTALTAGVLAWLANRFAKGPIANGVLWGGAAQVINVAVNAFAPPSISQYGLGDFVAGGFPLPQGSVRLPLAAAPMAAPNGSQVNVGAFGSAW